jgi:hypothetical protein
VAVRVIHGFKLVQIKQHDKAIGFQAARPFYKNLRHFQKITPVEYARKRVYFGHSFEYISKPLKLVIILHDDKY